MIGSHSCGIRNTNSMQISLLCMGISFVCSDKGSLHRYKELTISIVPRVQCRTLGETSKSRGKNPWAAAPIFGSQLQPSYIGKAIHSCSM